MREAIQSVLKSAGLELRRIHTSTPGTAQRPLGDLACFLEDVKSRRFEPKVILDIGANQGNWTRAVHPIFPAAKYFLFEPVALFAGQLKEVCDQLGVQYLPVGVSDSDAVIEMNEITVAESGGGTPGSTFMAGSHDARYAAKKVPVQVRSLDSLVTAKEIPMPDLVKIDVEGYELPVLKGAQSLLGPVEMFLIELSLYSFWKQPIFHEVVAWLAERGYVLYDLAGFNRRPRDGALGQVDACFVKTSSPLRRPGGWDD